MQPSTAVHTNLEYNSLQPGMWVKFGGTHDSIGPSEIQGPFKILTRENQSNDYCCYQMMNICNHKVIKYCPNTHKQGEHDLSLYDYEIKHLTKENFISEYWPFYDEGETKEYDAIQEAASKALKNLALQLDSHWMGFDPDNESRTLSPEQIRQKYGLG